MKFPEEDLRVRVSRSFDWRSCGFSMSVNMWLMDGDGECVFVSVFSGEGVFDERFGVSWWLRRPLQYCGYLVRTYSSTYCISVGVIGPDQRRSRPLRVEIASAIR